jgi:hypothetical protein
MHSAVAGVTNTDHSLSLISTCMKIHGGRVCHSPPCILVWSDLPWAGGALDNLWIFCIFSELRVACIAALLAVRHV